MTDGTQPGARGDTFAGSLELAAAAAKLTSPVAYRRLLRLIVETAASVLDAETGSLFLVDEETGELAFEVALGLSDEEVGAIRLEPGQGIAGMVASTGQPVAIRDVDNDPRHAAAIAHQLGRQPKSVLCVPLYVEDAVVGVLELLDKRNQPGFGQEDMATIALFANQAAVAIVQSRAQQELHALVEGLSTGAGNTGGTATSPVESAASLLFEIAGHSDADLQLATELLRVIAGRGRSSEGRD